MSQSNWAVPSRFPQQPAPQRLPANVRVVPIQGSHAPAVSRAVGEMMRKGSGWQVRVDKGRVVVIAGDHLEDRIRAALSRAGYHFYSFGNGTDVVFVHVVGKYERT